jgi:hypothetical protein
VPFPLEPLKVKWVVSVTIIVWSPFAAVLPWMPARIACWPVDKPCGATVPSEIGDVQFGESAREANSAGELYYTATLSLIASLGAWTRSCLVPR